MTVFDRRSYTRVSKNGVLHTVRASVVERNQWDRSGYQHESARDYYRRQLYEVGAGARASATFISPNARCPVCNAPVFYYQNQFGSRVFFDDIGKPWPKHPCTDNGRYARPSSSRTTVEEPTARDIEQVREIETWLAPAQLDPSELHEVRYGERPWTPYVLERKLETISGCLVALVPTRPRARPIFLSLLRSPRGLREKAIVFHHRETLSYFDLRTMTDREISGSRVPTAEAFVRELLRGRE